MASIAAGLGATVGVLLAVAAPALAAPGDVLLRVTGTEQADEVGSRVANAGDVDGDGRGDLLTSSQHFGIGMVVWGRFDGQTIELPSLPSADGNTIIDGSDGTWSWAPTSGGDVNGDGRPDQVFGSDWFESVYVVYGRGRDATPANVPLDVQGLTPAEGYRIAGPDQGDPLDAFDDFGHTVASIGDVNGDKRPDLAIGAPGFQGEEFGQEGSVFVVYGRPPGTAEVDLAVLSPSEGYRIDAPDGCSLGDIVTPAGDANGDGVPDVLLASTCGYDQGAAYVVFGRSGSVASPLVVDTPGVGYRMVLAHAPTGIASAGDVNGDGRSDAVVGSALGSPNGREDAGIGYVVYGQTANADIDLDSLPVGAGYRILGAVPGGWVGAAVSPAGDFDSDGVPDIALGAPHGIVGGRVYLLRGRADGSSLDLAALTDTDGYYLGGPDELSQAFGGALDAIGDMDGDGVAELAVGDVGYPRETDVGPKDDLGRAYVLTIARATPLAARPPVTAAASPAVQGDAVQAAVPALARRPEIRGRALVGSMLRCDVLWTSAASVRFAWLRGTRTIPNATGRSYRPRRADAGRALRCRSVAVGPGGKIAATSSALPIGRVCIVPGVVGMTLERARTRLKAMGCRVGDITIKRGLGRPGRVERTTPSAGNLRKAGTRVDIVLTRVLR